MKPNPDDQGRLSVRGEGLGTVTESMVRQRASEIALLNGRSEQEPIDSDWDEARRELSGEERLNPAPSAEESLPEGERWPAVAASTGGRVESMAAGDEQTFAEKAVEEGVADAEHDQAVQATRDSLKEDQ